MVKALHGKEPAERQTVGMNDRYARVSAVPMPEGTAFRLVGEKGSSTGTSLFGWLELTWPGRQPCVQNPELAGSELESCAGPKLRRSGTVRRGPIYRAPAGYRDT